MKNNVLLEQFNSCAGFLRDQKELYDTLYDLVIGSIQEKVSLTNPERNVWNFYVDESLDNIRYNADVSGDMYGENQSVYTMSMVDFLMTLDEYKIKVTEQKQQKNEKDYKKPKKSAKKMKITGIIYTLY